MKLPYLLPLLAVAAAHAEEKTDLATADAYRPQYDFSPPPVITPQTPFGQPLENQFDYQRPWVNPSVAQNVSTNTTRPLQIEASIGNLGDQERLLYTFHTAKGGIAQAGLMVSETASKEHADFLAALDKDLLAAVDWVANNGKSAAEIAANYMPAPVPALERAFPHSALCAIPAKDIGDEILQFLNELHQFNPKITGGKAVDASLLG